SLPHVSRVRPWNQTSAAQLQRPGAYVSRIADVRRSGRGEVRIVDRNFYNAIELGRTIADRVTQSTCGVDLDRQASRVSRAGSCGRSQWSTFAHRIAGDTGEERAVRRIAEQRLWYLHRDRSRRRRVD